MGLCFILGFFHEMLVHPSDCRGKEKPLDIQIEGSDVVGNIQSMRFMGYDMDKSLARGGRVYWDKACGRKVPMCLVHK